MAMLSNASQDQVVLIQKKGIYALFDPVLLSCEIGIKKPDIEVYHLLLRQLNLRPDECLFIDDAIQNVIAARSMGIDSVHFLNVDQLKAELTKREVSCPHKDPRSCSEISTATSLLPIREEIEVSDRDTLVLLDVGGTLLYPTDPLFHECNDGWKREWYTKHHPKLPLEERRELARIAESFQVMNNSS